MFDRAIKLYDVIEKSILEKGPNVLFALILFVVGWKIVNISHRLITKSLRKMAIDETLVTFLDSLFNILLKIALVIICASIMGIAFTSFVAIIGAASLAVGLSLQGSLSNFAGGVLILLLRPFRVGDYIETSTNSGTVTEIRIFYTYLKTPDNKMVVIPNGILSNNSLINYSAHDSRRLDLNFALSSDVDLALAKEIAYGCIEKDVRIFIEPSPLAAMTLQKPNYIQFDVRVWCKTEEYWDIYFELFETIKFEFEKNNIKFSQSITVL